MDFIFMTHEEMGQAHWFPNQPGVAEFQEARGWVRAEPPEQEPFVSPHLNAEPTEEWVTLVHTEMSASHEFPNNEAAIAGAYEAGWKFPEKEETSKKKASAKKATSSAKSAEDEKEKE